MSLTGVEEQVHRVNWVGMAGRRGQEVLLSCYCREIALPEAMARVVPRAALPHAPRGLGGAHLLEVQLPRTRARVVTAVASPSATGNYVYCAPIYFQQQGRGWEVAEWSTLARLLLEELGQRFGTGPQHELALQVADSVAVTAAILTHRGRGGETGGAFLAAEQGLLFGHSFHPAPKSRVGFTAVDVRRYSPELRTRLRLHWFAVRPEAYRQASVSELPSSVLRRDLGAAGARLEEGFHPIAVHPWQARALRGHPAVVRALRAGLLRDLGPLGPEFFPTSSVRTLYAPGLAHFYKCSLHVRITNCLRKNADYELEGALFATRIVRALAPALATHFPHLRVLEEPAFASVRLGEETEEVRRDVEERFALILRESLPPGSGAGERATRVAAALFGTDPVTRARLREVCAEAGGGPIAWFRSYVERLVPPLLHAFFAHGVVHEAHLQNTLLVTERGVPTGLLLRDLEGFKVVQGRFSALPLDGLSPQARRALTYGEEQGWRRVAYCLFVNNLAEAVAALAGGSERLEQQLWAQVYEVLTDYQQRLGTAASAPRVQALLEGVPFPGKANLTTRFLMRADREATYVPVPNPLARAREVLPWN